MLSLNSTVGSDIVFGVGTLLPVRPGIRFQTEGAPAPSEMSAFFRAQNMVEGVGLRKEAAAFCAACQPSTPGHQSLGIDSGRIEPTEGLTMQKIITRKKAIELGLKRFFTGKACRNGHIADRYVADTSCCECRSISRKEKSEENKEYFRQWRLDNPRYKSPNFSTEKENKMARDRYRKNPDAVKSSVYKWREQNPEKAKNIQKNSYKKHQDKRLSEKREYYANNKSIISKKGKEYRAKNAELRRVYTKNWRKNNPEKAKVSDRNKKAMRKGCLGKHSHHDVLLILQKQNGKCANCLIKLCEYHVDHKFPLSKGGSNWPENLEILCPKCNMTKHNKDPFDWAKENGRLL